MAVRTAPPRLTHSAGSVAVTAMLVLFMAAYLRSYRVHHEQREAVLESARAHAVYNVIIVVLVLITVVLIATGGASEP